MSSGYDEDNDGSGSLPDDGEWVQARAAYRAGLAAAQAWQPDARSALVEVKEYPPAHLNEEGVWEASYWSPAARRGLLVNLDQALKVAGQQEWGEFYQSAAVQAGQQILGPSGFSYSPEISPPGPADLAFIFRRASPTFHGQNDFVEVQISTTVMLGPPPRKFTINLLRNAGEKPVMGRPEGFHARLGTLLPDSKPETWWSFQNEAEYAERLREALQLVVQYGLAALM